MTNFDSCQQMTLLLQTSAATSAINVPQAG